MFWPNLVEIDPAELEYKLKMWKKMQTDKQQAIREAQITIFFVVLSLHLIEFPYQAWRALFHTVSLWGRKADLAFSLCVKLLDPPPDNTTSG